MAVLEVIKAGHPVLKQVATPVEFVNKKIRQLLDDMAETMYASDGVGLAAPQVGVSQRMLVLDDGNGLQEFINPEIVKVDGEQIGLEGCLSVPGYFGDVKRYNFVEVHYIDRHNKKKKIKAEGFLARILQHEIDHLNGILFVERLEKVYVAKDQASQIEEAANEAAEEIKTSMTTSV
ncbi:peptide deformylase [Veillonella magna]|uniref:peptide deformylase n=1 Tax=Veillonella magna TaxID=464322 RepID=UPI002665A12A|nr:peptide deformylase [Veillonella magna]